MNGARWQEVRALFEQIVALSPAQRRAALAASGGDATLVAEVERLLAAADAADAGDWLSPPGVQTLSAAAPAGLLGPRPGDRIGPYELLRLLGSGGMGTVFAARQELPARTVALKVMRSGLGSERARRRFREEIALLAKLQHPGIAQVYEAGDGDGAPWFAMELLEQAQPITAWAQQHALPQSARLALWLQIAAATEHAHQRGVIHRDIKPANILVDQAGRAKLIDFGIGHAVGSDLERLTADGTSGGELIGTLLYMSPERLVEADDQADVRSDVYGLGVVLYELVTDRLPFDLRGLSLAAACRRIVETEVQPPSRTCSGVPRELDWILQRALAKDRDRRYPSVAAFVADVQRLQRHEPVTAAPPSAAYRLRKLLRRHRGIAAAAAIVIVTGVGGFAATAIALVRAQAAEAAERSRRGEVMVEAKRAEQARAFLLDVFATASPSAPMGGGAIAGKAVTMGAALERAARRYEQRFGDDPMAKAELARTIGLAYAGLGDHDTSVRHLQAAIAVREQHFAGDTAALAGLHLDLADVQLQRGQNDLAAASIDRADALLAAHLDDRLVLIARVRRGELLLARADKVAAAAMLRGAIADLRTRFSEDDQDAQMARNQLGGVLHRLGDLDGAEVEYRSAATSLGRVLGEDHPATLDARHNLAMVLFSRNHAPEAVPMLEKVLAARQRVLGDDHYDTLATMVNLGAQRYILGDKDGAMTVWQSAADRALAQMPAAAPLCQSLLLSLATGERDRENWPRAIELGKQILVVRQEKLGPGHEQTLVAQTFLADVYRQSGDLDGAEKEFAAARHEAEARQPPDLPNVYRADLGLGRVAAARKQFEVSEAAFLRCRAGYDAAVGKLAVKSMLGRVEGELVSLYTAWGKLEEAARYKAIIEDASYRQRAGTGK